MDRRALPEVYMGTCLGKKRYDKKGAQTEKNYARSKGRANLRTYPCPRCNTWHVTKKGVKQTK